NVCVRMAWRRAGGHPDRVRRSITALLWFALACGPRTPSAIEAAAADSDPHAAQRKQLVDRALRRRDIDDPRVLAAIEAVPRHRFVPEPLIEHAYEDRPLPIGHEVTISQPYIVALMTQLADVQPRERVLEVGTGSGYQAAVLAEIGAEVYSIERVEALAVRAQAL